MAKMSYKLQLTATLLTISDGLVDTDTLAPPLVCFMLY